MTTPLTPEALAEGERLALKATQAPWGLNHECGDESVIRPNGFLVADCAIFGWGASAERNRANAALIVWMRTNLPALLATARRAEAAEAREAKLREMEAAIEAFLPRNLRLENKGVPDQTVVPLDCTMGELRALAALAPASEKDGEVVE